MKPSTSYNWMLAKGFMSDGTHANLPGDSYLAGFVWDAIGFFAIGFPHSLALQPSSNGVSISYPSYTGINYAIESSDDLLYWLPRTNSLGGGSNVTVTLPATGPTQAFRLRLTPSGN